MLLDHHVPVAGAQHAGQDPDRGAGGRLNGAFGVPALEVRRRHECGGACAVYLWLLSVNALAKQLKKARDVGSYKLVKRLGEGGMGEVWVARHKMLARPAAVKLIRSEMLGSEERSRKTALQRFQREARATAALKS